MTETLKTTLSWRRCSPRRRRRTITTPIGRVSRGALLCLSIGTAGACASGLTDVPDPSTIIDPAVVRTQEGAVELYRGSLIRFSFAFSGSPVNTDPTLALRGGSFVLMSGLAGDEFDASTIDGIGEHIMQRRVEMAVPGTIRQPYGDMHTARLNIDQAIGSLREYGKTTPKSYVGELFALKGYLYIMFAELYCSGVPFSRAVYKGDLQYGAPEPTPMMFEHAIANFDTALQVTTDNETIRHLAAVGKARALLNLGKFAEAKAAVSTPMVPTSFTYVFTYSRPAFGNFFEPTTYTGAFGGGGGLLQTANRLGTNGWTIAKPATRRADETVTHACAGTPSKQRCRHGWVATARIRFHRNMRPGRSR